MHPPIATTHILCPIEVVFVENSLLNLFVSILDSSPLGTAMKPLFVTESVTQLGLQGWSFNNGLTS